MPFEYMWGWIGIGRTGSVDEANVTSGASVDSVSDSVGAASKFVDTRLVKSRNQDYTYQ